MENQVSHVENPESSCGDVAVGPPMPSKPLTESPVQNEDVDSAEPSYSESRQMKSRGAGWRMQRAPLWMARAIYWGGLFGLFVCFVGAAALRLPGFGVLVVAAGFFWIMPFLGGKISRFAVRFLMHQYSCPGCHEVHDCVGVWTCGCGYKDHRERHVLAFKCPKCGARFRGGPCQRCDASILFW